MNHLLKATKENKKKMYFYLLTYYNSFNEKWDRNQQAFVDLRFKL